MLPDPSSFGPVTSSLVVGPHGEHIGPDGTSRSLGGDADFQWFVSLRRSAEVILTSGKTFRDENYQKPKSAELAVFSRSASDITPNFEVIRIGPQTAQSFSDAVGHLLSLGFNRIHCEFGPTGFVSLAKTQSIASLLSSESLNGIESFTTKHSLEFDLLSSNALSIARVGSVAVH